MKKITTGLVLVGLACLAAAFGAGFAIYLRPATASRNSSGTYSIPNTFVAGTTISSSSVNSNFSDLSTEMTNSLERNGKGGMLAALRGVDGTLAAPAFSWTSETGSGLFRNGASDVRMSISGGLRENWTSTGAAVTGTFSATGTGTFTQGLVSPIGIGNTSATYPLDIGAAAASGWTTARFRNTTSGSAVFVVSQGTTTGDKGFGFNLLFDGSNWKYDQTAAGSAMTDSGGALVFLTTPSGTAGNTATLTERLRVNPSGVTISTGVAADGSGFKHKRGTAGCTTAATAGAVCTTTVSWTTAFADTSYTAICFGRVVGAGSPVLSHIATVNAGSIVVDTMAVTAVASSFTNVDCIAVHD